MKKVFKKKATKKAPQKARRFGRPVGSRVVGGKLYLPGEPLPDGSILGQDVARPKVSKAVVQKPWSGSEAAAAKRLIQARIEALRGELEVLERAKGLL